MRIFLFSQVSKQGLFTILQHNPVAVCIMLSLNILLKKKKNA